MQWYGTCKECNEEQEVNNPPNYDGPNFCFACRSVDSIEEIEED